MVGCVLDALYDTGLVVLAGLGEFLDALIGRVRDLRKPLCVA
jgi:hypothetical protein